MAECCTSGNVLALGMESADMRVISENNLNSTPTQVADAVRIINEIGRERGENGMPRLLPGLNLIAGLDGETKETYDINLSFLNDLLEKDLLVRRINIRQVLPVRRDFDVKVNPNLFKRYKQSIRETVDHAMLQRIVPKGTVLKDVFMEINDGNVTFGRQLGSYPLLVGVPYRIECGKAYNIIITDWGFRSITGIVYPFRINRESMGAIASLPGIGKKRAANIVRYRPYSSAEDLSKVIDDEDVVDGLSDLLSFD